MDVKAVAQRAKTYVADLYSPTKRSVNVGLEEVEFDDSQDRWIVTIGFSRPWDHKNVFERRAGRGSPRPLV